MDNNTPFSEEDYKKQEEQIADFNKSLGDLVNNFLQFQDSQEAPENSDIIIRADATTEILINHAIFTIAASLVTFYDDPNELEVAKQTVVRRLGDALAPSLNERIKEIQTLVNTPLQ